MLYNIFTKRHEEEIKLFYKIFFQNIAEPLIKFYIWEKLLIKQTTS